MRSLAHTESPPRRINLTGLERLSVREIATRFGQLFNKPVQIVGEEAETALLSDARQGAELLGPPPTPIKLVMKWTADWIAHGHRRINKPTGFQVRDGRF